MAAGITVDFSSNPWVVTYNASVTPGPTQFTLPAQIWPIKGYAGPISPFIVKRLWWDAGDSAVGTNKVIIEDDVASPNGPNLWATFSATGADYTTPQEWKRAKDEGAPFGCTITQFDAGTLFIHF